MGKRMQGSDEAMGRKCPRGHAFVKTSACPVCPRCEQARKPATGFLSLLSAPARRALESKGIRSLDDLSGFSKTELLGLHGFGPASLPVIEKAMKEGGFKFR